MNYSTEETIVGTWINGKSIYKKSYGASGISLTKATAIDAILTTNYVEDVIKFEGSAKTSTGIIFFQRDIYSNSKTNVLSFDIREDTGLNINIQNYTVNRYALTVYYTKA